MRQLACITVPDMMIFDTPSRWIVDILKLINLSVLFFSTMAMLKSSIKNPTVNSGLEIPYIGPPN